MVGFWSSQLPAKDGWIFVTRLSETDGWVLVITWKRWLGFGNT